MSTNSKLNYSEGKFLKLIIFIKSKFDISKFFNFVIWIRIIFFFFFVNSFSCFPRSTNYELNFRFSICLALFQNFQKLKYTWM
jgi:hypothetical protein